MEGSVCSIPGNPDIAGVGVRASVYAQAILACLMILYTVCRANQEIRRRGAVDHAMEFFIDNARLLKQLALVLMLTGASLILSAIIEAKSSGGSKLTTYHALTVLNLSWINNLTGFSLHLVAMLTDPTVRRWHSIRKSTIPFLKNSWVFSMHSMIISVMGLWFWTDPDAFTLPYADATPSGPDCIPITYYWLPFVRSPVPSTNPGLRIVFLVVYSLISIPVISTITHAWPYLLCSMFQRIAHLDWALEGLLVDSPITAIFLTSPILILILITEKVVFVNREHLDHVVEEQWTYGQTLALFAALISIALVLVEMWKSWRNWRAGEASWRSAVTTMRGLEELGNPDWRHVRQVAEELQQISRRKLQQRFANFRDNRAMTIESMRRVLDNVEDWEQMRVVARQLEMLSVIALRYGMDPSFADLGTLESGI